MELQIFKLNTHVSEQIIIIMNVIVGHLMHQIFVGVDSSFKSLIVTVTIFNIILCEEISLIIINPQMVF